MQAALRCRRALAAALSSPPLKLWSRKSVLLLRSMSSSPSAGEGNGEEKLGLGLGFLNVEEVEKVLQDVKADDVRVIPVGDQCEWTDFMVIASGRSDWHVRNISQALIHKVKQKQKGADQILLPSVEGREGGQWIVIDSGTVIVHALHEKARAYYNLESLWTKEKKPKGPPNQDLEKAIVKTRRINNSKKPVRSAQ